MDFDAVALLDRQLADLSGGGDGDGEFLQAELQEARRLIAERDEDIRSYEGHLNTLESQRSELRTELSGAQEEVVRLSSTVEAGKSALAELQLRAARAQADARQIPVLLAALARRTLESEVLAAGIASAESDTAGAASALTELASSVALSHQNTGETASRAVHERAAAEKLLAEERHQSARLRGSVEALEEKLGHLSAQLAYEKAQLVSARETALGEASRIGTLEVKLEARDEALTEARASLAASREALNAAQQAMMAEARAGARHEAEVQV